MVNKRGCIFILCVFLLAGCQTGNAPGTEGQQNLANVWFSPKGGCTAEIVHEISAAKKSIKVQAYSFTSKQIAEALIAANGRGVSVIVILDKSDRTAAHSMISTLAAHGVTVLVDDAHAIAHNKIMLIDGETIITGSFNFTEAAENVNAENLLVIKDNPTLYKAYEENFERHRGHSKTFSEGRKP